MEGSIRASLRSTARGWQKSLIAILALTSSSVPTLAYAAISSFTGEAAFDYSGFLHSSNVRAEDSMVFSAQPDYQVEGAIASSRIQVQAKTFTKGPHPFTIEAPNLYVGTSKALTGNHSFVLGRKKFDWSKLDDHWKLGLYTPRFLWDPLAPDQLGRTGAFYTYEDKQWRFIFQASPLSIPEQSYPVKQVGTTLGAASPFWNPLPDHVELNGQLVPVTYSIAYPAANKFYLIPNVASSLRYGAQGSDPGGWVSTNYAYSPLSGSAIMVEPKINLNGTAAFDTIIHPTFPYHHLASVEVGFQERRWAFWGSILRDIPVTENNPGTWIGRPLDPSTMGSVGASVEALRGLELSSSYLIAHESKVTDPLNATLLSRQPVYLFSQAVDFTLKWRNPSRLAYDLGAVYDIDNRSARVSLDVTLVPRLGQSNWIAGIGFDAITSSTGQGWIGQFVGDDRVRWRLGYAF